MAGLCEGGNEPTGSLKASNVHNNRDSGAALVVECTLKQYASSSGRVKVVSLFLSEPRAVKMCAAIASPARCEIVTGDRTWVRYVNAETKLQSMQWGHTHFPKKPTKCRQNTFHEETHGNCLLGQKRNFASGVLGEECHN
ncbi:hypothetical protein ANN_20455 [Periplaneta americana]|uniref:Uncharacterized protein n=1 Tax=Periplaneta americana TaxID=6978 RepID=A0ABQ8SCS1_PERAM|nr:hypothetical protein ANN_20455 [Periplaneta americana]